MGAAAARRLPQTPYQFTSDWLTPQIPFWSVILGQLMPTNILEVGCYEGRATTFLIERCAGYGPLFVACIDTWQGSADLSADQMAGVAERFDSNIQIVQEVVAPQRVLLRKIEQPSFAALPRLLVEGASFDFIYIDGSHTAPDVLADAVMAFGLLRVGGVMIFDDYLWCMERHGNEDILNMPKMAIDAFVNIFARKLKVMSCHGQLALRKTA